MQMNETLTTLTFAKVFSQPTQVRNFEFQAKKIDVFSRLEKGKNIFE